MARQFSDEARRSAAIARKIKNRLGQQAYETYKRTGVVPAGLDNTPTASKRPDGPAASSAKPKGPGTPSKPKLEKLEPGKPSNYNGTFYKAKFAVIVNGEKVGEIRQQQHRIRQGSSYTTGWKNDFAEWKFFDAKGREVKLDQALSRARSHLLSRRLLLLLPRRASSRRSQLGSLCSRMSSSYSPCLGDPRTCRPLRSTRSQACKPATT
jgi:hypothetical protein